MMIAKAFKDNAPRRPIPPFRPRSEFSSLLSYWEINSPQFNGKFRWNRVFRSD